MTKTILETIGSSKVRAADYADADWMERDNFESIDTAHVYMMFQSRNHGETPYRIVAASDRFAVEFVPEWNLH